MDNLANPAERDGTLKSSVIVIIERHLLARTCILSILKKELAGFEIVEMATTDDLDRALARDVCLVVLDIGDKPIHDPCVENDLANLTRSFSSAPVALLSYRNDEATVSAAIWRGARGFFPTSIPVEVAIAGLRLVLAGGVYRPLSIDAETNEASSFVAMLNTCAGSLAPACNYEVNGTVRDMTSIMAGLTPREKHVLAALELGLPNKLIASKLNLSENTVKMHIQHIMRKCSARNRTEAVLRCSGRLSHSNGDARTRLVSSS